MYTFRYKNKYKYTVYSIAFVLLATAISIFWIDMPSFTFIKDHSIYHQTGLAHVENAAPWLTTEDAVLTLAAIIILTLILSIKPFSKRVIFIGIYIGIWLFITIHIAEGLKYIFGRCAPYIWFGNQCTFHPDEYGFIWFNPNFMAFPSGHCSIVSFCVIWLIYIHPRYFKPGLLTILILMAGLILSGYHFLGDCFAGLAVGLTCGLLSELCWKVITTPFRDENSTPAI